MKRTYQVTLEKIEQTTYTAVVLVDSISEAAARIDALEAAEAVNSTVQWQNDGTGEESATVSNVELA